MLKRNCWTYSVCLALILFGSADLSATRVLQMNLSTMSRLADKIFRGTVLDIQETRVSLGGAELPAVEYTIRVDEAFKGVFEEEKGIQVTRIRMIGSLKQTLSGRHPVPGFPLLARNVEYLLLVAPEGEVGLTSTMGLGQGCFSVAGEKDDKVVLNAANNSGLFAGMNVPGMPSEGAIRYSDLAEIIRSIVGGGD